MLLIPAFVVALAASALAAPTGSRPHRRHGSSSDVAEYGAPLAEASSPQTFNRRSWDDDSFVTLYARGKKKADNTPTLHSWTLPNGNQARITQHGHDHIISRDDTHRADGAHPHMPDNIRNNLHHVLQHATTHGTVVAHQNPGHGGGHPRPIYKFNHDGQEHHMAISVHEDGRVLGANMSSASQAAHWNSVAGHP